MISHKIKKILLVVLFVAFLPLSYGGNALTLDLENANLAEALRIIAKFMHLSIVLSPGIMGNISLHLHDATAQQAFNLLLASQGLEKLQVGTVLFVAPRTELANQKQAQFKLQETLNEVRPLVTKIWQIQYAKATDIGHFLQDNTASLLSKRGHVRIDARTNKLCVQDLAENIVAIYQVVKKLDVPVQQVLIDARLVSVDSDFERQLGISFTARQPGKESENAARTVTDTGLLNAHFSVAVATLADGAVLDIALAAMENAGKGELISSPSLFTANQQSASIESGEEIPYQEVSLSGGTGIAFKKAVLSLKVLPQIMPGNKVLLQLQVNQDRPSSRIVLGVPAISTRQVTTNILVNNGQTLVLGGIYELNQEHAIQRVPFLGKIPVVGILFQQQNTKENKRELLIFVTPRIIS
jgi:type IV pilus assembly protein PilQ